ncbi:MAG: S49 family peptidase [Bacteroidota bacterium]
MTGLLPILASTQIWEIEETTANNLKQVLGAVLSKDKPFNASEFKVGATRPQYRPVKTSSKSSKREFVLIQPIQGVMMSSDQICSEGMSTMSRRISQAILDEEIAGMILDIDSPGGAANGSGELARAIREFSQVKPVVAYVRGEAASAALKQAVSATHVMMGGDEAQIGSVGTVISYWDLSEYYRRQDIRFVEVASSNTPEKRAYNFDNPTPADLQKIDDEILTPHSERFKSWVRELRPNVSEESLSGSMYYADQAIEYGLADSIGTFNQAFELIQELTQSDMFGKKKTTEEKPQAASDKPSVQTVETVGSTEDPAPKVVENQEPNEEPVTRAEFEALKAQTQKTHDNQATITKQLNTMTTLLERMSSLPANEIADPDGDEGVPSADTQVTTSEFGAFYEKERAAYRLQVGL